MQETIAYLQGRSARIDARGWFECPYRALAALDTDWAKAHEKCRTDWLRGWHDQDAEIKGVQPDPRAAKLVSDVAVLLEKYGDHFFDS